jgi:hypothetical protein
MNTLQLLIVILIIVSAWPIGKIISKNTKEELAKGKRFFYMICIACLIGIVLGLALLQGNELILAESALDFIFLLSLSSIHEANKLGRK